ncbi:monocarboxylate transporter 2-like isoform X1 [Eriocheir sinensis]|uniref:monocarboxylate transporter 2-like isoform X1 n=3 Tax=Eriocheir sinensis TaxID=95602 RepID=UPI0021C9EB4C|nr:monocarboxylate transporter 2-like isoform X1 [Eriocheir sinensis]
MPPAPARRENSVHSHKEHDKQQSTSVMLEDDSHPSTSVTREGKDGIHQFTIERKDGTQQSSSSLCPASPEPPLLPLLPPSARDKGYAWVIVWAVFGINTLVAGYIKSFGIMYLLLLQHFPEASGAESAWVMGLLFGTRSILSPFMGALTVKFGPRRCCLLGTVLIILGLLLAIPMFSILYMALTLGAIVGVGLCMSETPGYILVNDYFLERRPTANGCRAAGNSTGGILFPPLLVFLNEQFGLQGTFIMLAGTMMHLAVLGSLLRPFELHQRMIHHQHTKTIQETQGTTSTTTMYSDMAVHTHKDKHPSKKALDFTLFKNPQYLIYLGLAISVTMALPNFLVFVPAYAFSVGLTEYQISIITSYFSGADVVLRLLSGYLTDKLSLNGAHIFTVGLVVGGVGCMLVPLCSTIWQIILAITLFAFGMATFWALINTLMADEFGAELTASTWGFFRMVQGICGFIYPSLLGLAKDVTGGYAVPFLIMGSAFIVGSGIFLLRSLVAKCSDKRAERHLS